MGAGQSGSVEIGGSTNGYQVLRVYPNSPGSRAGLKAYFDFIVAIGNTRFNKENGSLREILKASVDQKLKMIVFNTRSKSTREVEIVPSTNWGGNGLLGVSIKHSSFERADERVWHVVDVEPGSPAQQAGFKAGEDYIIGSDSILQESDDLYNLVEAHEGKALKLFIYNVNTDNCREVICHPNSKWGGKGFLGCEFGHGLLHRIPYDDAGGDMSDNPRASLLRNEQPPASRQLPQSNNPFSFQNQVMQMQQSQRPAQPGMQLLQQALSDDKPSQQMLQRQPEQQPQPLQDSSTEQVLPPPPQAPQTFAQLASAQYQAPQYYSPPPQVPQQQQPQQQELQQPHHQQQPQQQPPPPPQQQQPPQLDNSTAQSSLPPLQAPQPFAQPSSVQYQAPQYYPPPPQAPQQLQLQQPHPLQDAPVGQLLPPPPQAPQSFAQPAVGQYQPPQYYPPPPQVPQQQQQQQPPQQHMHYQPASQHSAIQPPPPPPPPHHLPPASYEPTGA